MATRLKELLRGFYPTLAAALLVMLGLGLIHLLVMDRISALEAFGVLIALGVVLPLAMAAGRRG